jgi:NAD-dependent SIR2 family protein deacetylase
LECKTKYDIELIDDIKYKILFHLLYAKGVKLPDNVQSLIIKEIHDIKYKNLIDNFKNNKYSKILFMVGAGISTSAGIPDFRSNTGLFKQLQDKYNLSSPEEFFLLSTFYSNPKYFYEFTKLFDLSKINSTISHKFMNFFVQKNMVKYVFTQNIDGLEIKAKIPKEKLVFAHGNFYEGNCPKCDILIDIEKINEAIEKGEIYYCPQCKGPTKPYVVFYGEGLPKRFFEKIQESKDIDLIIIMGTSLKVQPFASIPYLTNKDACKLVFNMEKVGEYGYDYLDDDSVFIEGKTDKSVIKFLKDINMFDEFAEFVKKEYNEDLNNIMNIENKLINVNDKKENEEVKKLADDLDNLDLK